MHSTPGRATALTAGATACDATPRPGSGTSSTACLAWHADVPGMHGHHRPQVLALLRDGVMHALSEFELDRLEFVPQALGTRELTGAQETSCPHYFVLAPQYY